MTERARKYSEELASENFGLPDDEVTPSAIREELPPIKGLRPISQEARLGGKLTGNLKELSDEEAAAAKKRSEEFLKQPPVRYPAEEAREESAHTDD